ncbi:hypothetical protein KKG41_04365 [Patescibacteria group bacterium]|nr:hypothetical protein [Patescibacteria group bacterium]MBU1890006.1 hypothetical protein [Patescibacteria group bacterium]
MKKYLTILIVLIIGLGTYYIINENCKKNINSTTIDDKTTKMVEKNVTNYETISFRDENHAIYLKLPRDWKTSETNYETDERTPMLRSDLDVTDEYGVPVGSAVVTYYDSNGLTLEEWTRLHFVNDIKGEFGEDFIMTSFNSKMEKGVEIVGTNKLHPLWPVESNNIWSYTYFYYLNNGKVYEFELRLPEKYLGDYKDELDVLRDSVYFGEPFDLDEWNTYTNEEKGFSVKYPSAWNVSEHWEQVGGLVGFDENENVFAGHIVVITTPTEEGYTSSLAGQTRLENVQLSYPRIGGVSAVRICGDVPEPTYGFSDYSDSVYVMVDGIKIEMTYQETGFDLESREYFSQMIRTFEFVSAKQ